jgi:Protein of unknown function (DUF3617)
MRPILLGLVLLLSGAVWAADKIQPLNVKTGLWETTRTSTTSGQMPIPPELLARLTPEQRAKMEERMKANSAEKSRTNTSKSCLTKEKLEKAPFSDEQKDCTRTIVTSTSSEAEIKFVCDKSGMKANGTIHVEAITPESVKGSAQTAIASGGRTMNTSGSFTSKWLGPNCGDVQ